jgi:PiT family inorganic phosphate transporter
LTSTALDIVPVLLVAAAGTFAVANGANDGGALVAVGLQLPSPRPWVPVAVLALSVCVVPLVLGTAVATTLATQLVAFDGLEGQLAILAALVATAIVVVTLTRRGIPTSLTLAVVGGIAGAGVGSRLPVGWRSVTLVLLVAAVAPLVGMTFSYALTRLVALRRPAAGAARRLPRYHILGFVLVCVAYGANDGQKMLAVFAVAFGVSGTVEPDLRVLAGTGALFAIGTALGVRRFGNRFASGVLAARPVNAVAAELSAGAAVLATAAIGAPVSMTQAVTGGLVGTGVSDGLRRVRWRVTAGIVAAWLVTLPATFIAAAVLAFIIQKVAT